MPFFGSECYLEGNAWIPVVSGFPLCRFSAIHHLVTKEGLRRVERFAFSLF